MRIPGLLILSFGLLLGCAKKVPTDPQRFERIDGPGYAYQRMDDGAVIVAAQDQRALHLALDAIGCGKEYICLIEPNGQMYEVRQ